MISYIINLQKNHSIIGNIIRVGAIDIMYALNDVSELIQNYNRNLISEKIPNAVLAHRFLEKENVECDIFGNHSKILPKSYELCRKAYLHYNWPDNNCHSDSKIALFSKDIEKNNGKSNHHIYIDLTDKKIGLLNIFRFESKREFCRTHKIKECDFNIEDLTIPDFNPETFSFNSLQDVLDYLEKCGKVFKHPRCDLIGSCMNI